MRRNFYFTCVLGAKVAPGTVRKAKGDGQLRPEFLEVSQVATKTQHLLYDATMMQFIK